MMWKTKAVSDQNLKQVFSFGKPDIMMMISTGLMKVLKRI
jgi:hypothetical protein